MNLNIGKCVKRHLSWRDCIKHYKMLQKCINICDETSWLKVLIQFQNSLRWFKPGKDYGICILRENKFWITNISALHFIITKSIKMKKWNIWHKANKIHVHYFWNVLNARKHEGRNEYDIFSDNGSFWKWFLFHESTKRSQNSINRVKIRTSIKINNMLWQTRLAIKSFKFRNIQFCLIRSEH